MTRRRRILVVDDARETLELLQRRLEARGFVVALAASVDEAIAELEGTPFDLVLTDLRMPGRSGMDLVRHVRERHPQTAVIMVTGYATIQGAVDAVKSGAQEYLAKPFTSVELRDAVDRALERADAARREAGPAPAPERFGLVGASSGMRDAFDVLGDALATRRPVVLSGEPGTGRRAAARALLAAGGSGALVDFDARDIARVDAGTGAGSALLRHAELLQPESLAALKRLAASLGRRGARLFLSAAPLADDDEEAARRRLWEALHAHRVFLPPLRERAGDVLLLARRFAGDVVAPEVEQLFAAYPWPGNVAELEQVVATASARARGRKIGPGDLPAWLRSPDLSERSLADIEAEHIARVLKHTRGNRSRAAEILGINRRTLGEKLKDPGQKR